MFSIPIMLRRACKRHVFTVIFIAILSIVIFVLISFFGNAFASESKEVKFLNQKPEQYIIARPATTTTTTSTTTLPPVKKKAVQPATLTAARQVAAPTGDWTVQCRVWMAQAGIPADVHDTALKLIDKESDCGATAQNPRSTAYGIGQFLDSTWKGVRCVKTSDPVEQLRCMALYVVRHGGWQGALTFRINEGWY